MDSDSMNVPEGLSYIEYARHILEEVLGFPCKGNLELMADCLRSIGKSKSLSAQRAHGYMVRAIRLAKEQGIDTDRMWFMSGEYTHVRPQGKLLPKWKSPDMKAFEEHQKTPEYQQAKAEMEAALRKLAGKLAMK